MNSFSELVRAFTKNHKPKVSEETRKKQSEAARLSWLRRRDWVANSEQRRLESQQAQMDEARQLMAAIETMNERIRQRDKAREKS